MKSTETVEIRTENLINILKSKPWKEGEFKKQNWGIWLHRMSPYVGRIKPSFAHWLIKLFSDTNQTILDPFCGIGTIPLEGSLLGRRVIGIDLNPYAVAISKAKFDRRGLKNELEYLSNIKINLEDIDLSKVSDKIKEYYHPKTLKEIIALRNLFLKDNRYFLLGCLLAISHGHRQTQHLSIRTGYIIPYLPNPRPPKEYREVIPRLIKKVIRMYKDDFPLEINGEIYETDSRNLPLKDSSVDVVITSPPYYDTLDYASYNFLRLGLLKLDRFDIEGLKNNLIQDKKTYLEDMHKVALEIKRVLKNDSFCVLVLGDVNKGNLIINTAEEVEKIYKELGFKILGIVDDEIPKEKTTIAKFGGKEGITKKKIKLDRILIMINKK